MLVTAGSKVKSTKNARKDKIQKEEFKIQRYGGWRRHPKNPSSRLADV